MSLFENTCIKTHYSHCHLPTGSTFEGGEVEVYTVAKSLDYPRDPATNEITAAIHPQLQVQNWDTLTFP